MGLEYIAPRVLRPYAGPGDIYDFAKAAEEPTEVVRLLSLGPITSAEEEAWITADPGTRLTLVEYVIATRAMRWPQPGFDTLPPPPPPPPASSDPGLYLPLRR